MIAIGENKNYRHLQWGRRNFVDFSLQSDHRCHFLPWFDADPHVQIPTKKYKFSGVATANGNYW